MVPVVDGGVNVALTPAGSPAAPKRTLPVKPFTRVMVIVLTADAPCWTDTLAGLAESEKSGVWDAVTASETFTVRTSAPLVPVTVTCEVPTGVLAAAANVTVLLLPVVDAGLNVAVAPAGRPLAVKVTAPVKPIRRVMAIVLAAVPPWLALTDAGLAASEKSGPAGTGSTPQTSVPLL